MAGINVDGGRIGVSDDDPNHRESSTGFGKGKTEIYSDGLGGRPGGNLATKGRWPANLLLDEESGALLDEQSGVTKSSAQQRNNAPSENVAMSGANTGHISFGHSDSGGASRFFYCAKASKSERNAGCEDIPTVECRTGGGGGECDRNGSPRFTKFAQNIHPTVKPLKLMEYLCTLTKTPTGGIVLDPFMGSGTTGLAAKNTGRSFIGCELSAEYFNIAEARINAPNAKS